MNLWSNTIKNTLLCLPMILLAACGSDSDEAGRFTIQGAVEKGPFIVDSTVTINQLSNSGENTNQTTVTSTTDDLGSFNFASDHTGLLQISASGYYRNEITGELSQGILTLRSLYKVSNDAQQRAYINLLTHISNDRILKLIINDAMAFNQALAQAESEFLLAFSSVVSNDSENNFTQLSIFATDASGGSAYLLAVSSIMYQYAIEQAQVNNTNPDAELSQLVNQLKADFADNGVFDDSAVLQDLKNTIPKINPNQVSSNINEWIAGKDDYAAVDINEYLDSDLDGEFNASDWDDDNDGYSDAIEISEGSDSFNASITPLDQDKDGIPDSTDSDRDGDGIPNDTDDLPDNATEKLDTDGDKIGNLSDLDDDNDNWSDLDEAACGTDGLDKNSTPTDTDGDGICNLLDTDDDNDSWADTIETACSTDGLDNGSTPTDTDNDGTCNYLDDDDDGDGYNDSIENAEGSAPLDASNKPVDQDGDFIPDSTDIDDDGNGLIEITTLDQLDWIRNDLAGTSLNDGINPANNSGCDTCNGYELKNDLDFDTNSNGTADEGDEFYNSGEGWLPTGAELSPFIATFEGNGYTIHNLYINRTTNYIGLFGRIGDTTNGHSASIQNLTLSDVLITGANRSGALVGLADNATLDNCHSNGTLISTSSPAGGLIGRAENNSQINNSSTSGQVTTDGELGGLVGSTENNVTISGSFSSANITSTSDYVGGLLGYGRIGITITNSYATGDVTATGNNYVGGLVGTLDDNGTHTSIITNSYATGNVSANTRVGGLVGEVQGAGTITNSYALGDIEGTGNYVGGLMGYSASADISISHATGSVTGVNQVGGLVGGASTNGSVKQSYATGAVTAGNNVGGLLGRIRSVLVSESFAMGSVYGVTNVGGLVGYSSGTSFITASYTRGRVDGENEVGGLGGRFTGTTINASYATGFINDRAPVGGALMGMGDNTVIFNNTYWANNIGGAEGNSSSTEFNDTLGVSLDELKCPTSANDSVCVTSSLFVNWDAINHDNNNVTNSISPWSFNTGSQLPSLTFSETLNPDRDNDGTNNPEDAFPDDADETLDTDGDGTGNNADLDDDGDGYSDLVEASEGADSLDNGDTPIDLDGDFIPDSTDDDDDGDGENDVSDNCPLTANSDQANNDGDSEGDVCDSDDDNDTVEDIDDNCPMWANLDQANNDGDSEGDDCDSDDDNDGTFDRTDIDQDGDGLIEIYTLEQLDWMRNDLTGASQDDGTTANTLGCSGCNGYELMNDLDFDTNQSGTHDAGDDFYNSNEGWLAIGDRDFPFVAIFEGNNHKIKNLYINRASTLLGLFGHTGDAANSLSATIQNIYLTGDVTVNGYSGALIGWADNTSVNNCSSEVTITGNGSGSIGGLIGGAESGTTINNSFSTGKVTGTGSLGGLVGYTDSSNGDVSINNSYASGDVEGTGNEVGGLIGFTETNAFINNSYATGNVNGANDIGGLIGKASGTLVSQSYASGSVSGADNVGGLIGKTNSAFVAASFAQGNVEGDSSVGGLGGDFLSTTVTASYATGAVTFNVSDGAGLVGRTEKTNYNQSYWASDSTGMDNAIGTNYNTTLNDSFAVLLNELMCPTAADTSGCVASDSSIELFPNWDAIDHDNDGATDPIAPWNFNANSELPTLNIE